VGTIALELVSPRPERVAMRPLGDGWFEAVVEGVGAGARYGYLLDGDLSVSQRIAPARRIG
jgi:1,4-alpha-glucan branching enzyme